jgi:hypothetical protein
LYKLDKITTYRRKVLLCSNKKSWYNNKCKVNSTAVKNSTKNAEKISASHQLANQCFLTALTASRLSPATWQGVTHPNVCTRSIDGSE